MPIELTTVTVASDDAVAEMLESDGKPTVQAEVLERFLSETDFDSVFDELLSDEETAELVDVSEEFGKWDSELDGWVACDEGDEGAELIPVQSIAPEVAESYVDTDDLGDMFDFYMEIKHDHSTLQGQVELKSLGYEIVAEDETQEEYDALDERKARGPFKKGDFRKMRGQKGGEQVVNRMLGAMLNKEAIKRAPKGPGTGYKKGDYKKDAGYGAGSAKGIKKWSKYVTTKSAQVAKSAKAAKKAVKVGGKTIGGKKTVAKQKAQGKGKAAAAAAKKAKRKKKTSRKKLAASTNSAQDNLAEGLGMVAPNVPVLHEGSDHDISLLKSMGVGVKK